MCVFSKRAELLEGKLKCVSVAWEKDDYEICTFTSIVFMVAKIWTSGRQSTRMDCAWPSKFKTLLIFDL